MISSLLVLVSLIPGVGDAADTVRFNEHVRPILSKNCFSCHGPAKSKAGLRLDLFESATNPRRKGGAAIIPGKPGSSLLIKKITSTDPDEIMPPPDSHKKLESAEKALLKTWISQGARYEKHWSLIPVKKPSLPRVKNRNWSTHPIDQFSLRRMEAAGLKPQAAADKRTLIRRVTLDLTGLPPTSKEIADFLADRKPDGYERLVDRLLASSRYGEHLAHYWLDLVRYADTHGIHKDNYREMYLYRDWVIHAFNSNVPYDRFTLEQIAGDMVENPTPEQLIASGFNRLPLMDNGGSALPEELYVRAVRDRVDSIGTVYFGLTLGCAKCHDHKYDPITQKEYYQLFAFFNNEDGPATTQRKAASPPALKAMATAERLKLSALEEALASLGESKSKRRDELRKQIASIKKRAPRPMTMIMREKKDVRPAFFLNRGQYDKPGDQVERKTPASLPPMARELPLNRLGFARWLINPGHPLVARVAVNRFWQQCFGVGIVKTSEDFGSKGEWPSHPGLLDYLTADFMENGWDVKRLMKQIVTSRTYRQRSQASPDRYRADPENRLLARGARFRMDAETIRDQALYVSGQLVETLYGPSVKPPQPKGVWDALAVHGSNTRFYKPDRGEKIYRRSVYTFWKRAVPHPVMTIFNAPRRERCVARRERTNTPLQALVLMNEVQYFQAARKLAELTLKAGGATDPARLAYCWERVTSRVIDRKEREILTQALGEFRRDYGKAKTVNLAGAAVPSEVASWTMLMNILFNLDAFKTKD